MGMVVCAVKNIVYAVFFSHASEKSTHNQAVFLVSCSKNQGCENGENFSENTGPVRKMWE
jgi:hypothetical protein